ncbi:hypothetical protein BGW38_007090 [Lunasporangiospora selenospora]|uniref:Extracellular membrane protein CFEM domain-containing protein n=1 Tax=Lunasporangiospora selenospora TaxID=979761 RepID=A0A9P6KGN0_9FUNG|nr:hypothetical protein BGW38_007090 [Lunasporangiospora selenospora]
MKVSIVFALFAVVALVQAAPHKNEGSSHQMDTHSSQAKVAPESHSRNAKADSADKPSLPMRKRSLINNEVSGNKVCVKVPVKTEVKNVKSVLVTAALAAAVTVSAYECPSTDSVNQACRNISVSPLVCNNPNVNVQECNARQCNQDYINNYAACMCRRNRDTFFENSVNVEGLIRRCGGLGLVNPYGNPNQYRPGQGTQTFSPSGGLAESATRVYGGTTYYGGSTADVSGVTRIVSATPVVGGTTIVGGTTTWISDTPSIQSGTSTFPGATAEPVQNNPDEYIPVNSENSHVSGGAVAGIVLGILAATALAILLGICWRKKRSDHFFYHQHNDADARGPIRTVVTEKIEPVVVKSVPAGTATSSTAYNAVGNSSVPAGTATYTTATNPAATTNYYNQGPGVTTPQYNTSMSPSVTGTGVHSPTGVGSYSTGNAYSTQPRTGVVDSVSNTAHNAVNSANNAAYNASNAVQGSTTTTGR